MWYSAYQYCDHGNKTLKTLPIHLHESLVTCIALSFALCYILHSIHILYKLMAVL